MASLRDVVGARTYSSGYELSLAAALSSGGTGRRHEANRASAGHRSEKSGAPRVIDIPSFHPPTPAALGGVGWGMWGCVRGVRHGGRRGGGGVRAAYGSAWAHSRPYGTPVTPTGVWERQCGPFVMPCPREPSFGVIFTNMAVRTLQDELRLWRYSGAQRSPPLSRSVYALRSMFIVHGDGAFGLRAQRAPRRVREYVHRRATRMRATRSIDENVPVGRMNRYATSFSAGFGRRSHVVDVRLLAEAGEAAARSSGGGIAR